MIIGGGSGSGTIADGSIIEQKLSAGVQTKLNAVASGIVDNSVQERHILDGAVTANKIFGNCITTDRIADRQITYDKLGLLAVKNANIFTETIQGGQNGKIAGSTITGWNIADGTITTTQIQTGTILGEDIANNQIYDYHLHSSLATGLASLSTSITNLNTLIDTLATPRGTIKIVNAGADPTNDNLSFTYVVSYVNVATQVATPFSIGRVSPLQSSTDFYRLPTYHTGTHIKIVVTTDTANGYVVMSSPTLVQGVASTISVSNDFNTLVFSVNSATNYAHTNIIIAYVINN